MRKQIPYGVTSYEKLIEDNYYYVDKTAYIRELEGFEAPVFLRPRRFGKSLWCSTLACYYDINRKDRFQALFGNTDIGRAPTPSHSSMLTLEFDFSKIPVRPTVEGIEQAFLESVRNRATVFSRKYRAYADFSQALKSETASGILDGILTAVEAYGLPKLCVIIDEYDNFTNQLVAAGRDDDYRDITTSDSFLKTFYKTLKAGAGANAVGRVFITGVLPVTLDDLTSGFNIGEIVGHDPALFSMMGFTQAELEKYAGEIFADYGWGAELRRRALDDMENLYNGYRFLPDAKETLYNPTACNFYLKEMARSGGALPVQSIDTNLRADLDWFRRLAGKDYDARDLVTDLLTKGTVSADLAVQAGRYNLDQLRNPAYIPMTLFHLGLLTYAGCFTFGLPNSATKVIAAGYFNFLYGLDGRRT